MQPSLTYYISFESLKSEQRESGYNLEIKFCDLVSHFVRTVADFTNV